MQYLHTVEEICEDITEILEGLVEPLRENHRTIMHYVLPVLWLIACIITMSLHDMWSNSIYTVLGVFAACLANCVPVGGGIVYIPVFALLGKEMTGGVVFTVATMSFGNGVFGLLNWLQRDREVLLLCELPYVVLPTWIGYLVNLALVPTMPLPLVRLLFGLFSLLVGLFVLFAVRRGGVEKLFSPSLKQELGGMGMRDQGDLIEEEQGDEKGMGGASVLAVLPRRTLHLLSVVSFTSGFVLLSSIGIGPGLVTFVALAALLGHAPGFKIQAALVTGVVAGGIVCWLPLLLHAFMWQDVPMHEWLMVLPGVYTGAFLAPLVSAAVGTINMYYVLSVVLFVSSVMYLVY